MHLEIYWIYILLYILTGLFAGCLAGLLGVGGGIIVVPALAFIFEHNPVIPSSIIMHMATASSLAIMVLTAQASARAHQQHGRVLWRLYLRMSAGLLAGAVGGVILSNILHTKTLSIIFAIFLLMISIQMFTFSGPKYRRHLPGHWGMRGVGFVIGGLSGLLGIGGGTLTIPFLIHCRVPMRGTAGVAALASVTVALTGTLTFIITGIGTVRGVPWSIGYIYLPAVFCVGIPSMLATPWGAKLTYRLPVKTVRKVFTFFLAAVSIKMLVNSFY